MYVAQANLRKFKGRILMPASVHKTQLSKMPCEFPACSSAKGCSFPVEFLGANIKWGGSPKDADLLSARQGALCCKEECSTWSWLPGASPESDNIY